MICFFLFLLLWKLQQLKQLPENGEMPKTWRSRNRRPAAVREMQGGRAVLADGVWLELRDLLAWPSVSPQGAKLRLSTPLAFRHFLALGRGRTSVCGSDRWPPVSTSAQPSSPSGAPGPASMPVASLETLKQIYVNTISKHIIKH